MPEKSPRGFVSLVGAGPGDPGLLTLKAKRRLEEAQVVVYDALANPEHLRHAPRSARVFRVTRADRKKSGSQARINRLIVRWARRGQRVVRLKGGDPYLFGRGGEEALFLRRSRIPFEVVPGVTSATACAAYAGIPLTHRDHNASVTFLTGHRAKDGSLDSVDWGRLASSGNTLVIYMGLYNLGRIALKLIEAGLSRRTPAAVIEWGTLPRQRSCTGTLAGIQETVRRRGICAPAIIIIGRVVALKPQLDWFERLPLFGKTLLVTRTRESAGTLRGLLADRGGRVLECPTLEIGPAKDFAGLDRAIRDLASFDWIVFASAHGVSYFMERLSLRHRLDARALGGVRIASVGPETARALRQAGLRADLEPERFETRALIEAFRRGPSLAGKRVLLVRSNLAPEPLETGLASLGAVTVRAEAYRTDRPRRIDSETIRALSAGAVDLATFTSASSADHFAALLGPRRLRRVRRTLRCASIGPMTSAALRRHRFRVVCEADPHTLQGLVQAASGALEGLKGRRP